MQYLHFRRTGGAPFDKKCSGYHAERTCGGDREIGTHHKEDYGGITEKGPDQKGEWEEKRQMGSKAAVKIDQQ